VDAKGQADQDKKQATSSECPEGDGKVVGWRARSANFESRPSFAKRLVLIPVVLDLLFVGLAGLWLQQSRLRYEDRANVTTQNLSLALTGHVDSMVDQIDLTVLMVADEVTSQLAAKKVDAKSLNMLIARQQARLPFMDGLRIVSAEGENIYGTGVTPGVRTSVADRPYFQRLRNDRDAGLVISDPLIGRVSKKWSIVLAHRLNASDGSFAGLVYGTIAIEQFLTSFSFIDVGKLGSIALRSENMALIARSPEPSGFSQVVGKRNVSWEIQNAVSTNPESGTYRTDQAFDKIQRTYSYRKVPDRPLYIIVGLARDEYLVGWRSECAAVLLVVALVIFGTVLVSWLLYRVWLRRTTAAQAKQAEAIRVREANFRAFFESMSDMIVVTTPAGQIEHINSAIQERLGYSATDLAAMPVFDLTPANQRENAQAIFAAALRGERQICRLPLVTKQGGVIPVETRIWFGRWNGADCIFELSKDLTTQEEAQQRFERLFCNNPALMAVISISDKRFRDVNDAFLKVLGYSRAETIGKTGLEIGLYSRPEQVTVALAELQTTGHIANLDLQLRRKDGGIMEGLISGEVIRHQGQEFLLSVMLDITDRKRAEDELRSARAFLDSSINAIADPIFVKDEDRRYVLVNDAMCSIVGRPREELLGKRGDELFPREQADVFQKMDTHVFETGVENVNEESLSNLSNGEIRTLITRKTLYIDPIGKRFLVGVMRDVTERKWLEVQLGHARKLEAVGQLAAGVAHEINTPTQYVGDGVHFLKTAFDGYRLLTSYYRHAVEVLEKICAHEALVAEIRRVEEDVDLEYLDTNVPASIESCKDGISRISTIVRAMKEFAHPDQSEMAPADLNQALRTTLAVARNEYKYVAEVVTEFNDLPAVVCHVGDLNQVFLNLIVNAAHAIADVVGQGELKGTIRIRTLEEGDQVRIDITDTGSGIPESIRHRIFDPFFTTKEVGKGTGQGLAIARSIIVSKHHGSLTFESEVGKGTTFSIRLPMKAEAAVTGDSNLGNSV